MQQRLLGGLTSPEFLARHWQKEPLLVRGAFPDFRDPLTPDELAGLALEETAHSRLVLEKAKGKPWLLEHGPFPAARFKKLPATHWSLLVSNVDQWSEAAARLLEPFRFVPDWRLDDLMVSYAPAHGSVGPHVDSYDVFLIQGLGRRRWQIAKKYEPTLIPNIDLKVLRRFRAEAEWILEPGDMLYLPPGVAHYGVALTDCLTYSVGFRAPAQQELLTDLYKLPQALAAAVHEDRLYSDPNLQLQDNPGEITMDAVRRVEELVRAPLARPEILGRWFGMVVTQPARGQTEALRRRVSPKNVEDALSSGRTAWRGGAVRVAFLAPPAGGLFFYADGDELVLQESLLPLARAVTSARCLPAPELARALPRGRARQAGLAFLAELAARDVLYFAKKGKI